MFLYFRKPLFFDSLPGFVFLSPFAKLRKRLTASSCQFVHVSMSICLHATTRFPLDGISEKWYLRIFWKSVKKSKVSLNSAKNKRYFTWRPTYHLSLNFPQYKKCFKVVKKIKKHILCPIAFFIKLYLLWDNVEKQGTAGHATDNKTVGMFFACWITKVTNTNSE